MAADAPARRRAIALGGFMGVGKSTVGPILGRRLKLRVVDLDDRVVAREGRSVAALFDERGEAGFRAAEAAALAAVLAEAPVVVSLGGGTLHQPACRALLADHAVVVLHAPLSLLIDRIAGSGRPLAADAEALYAARAPGYAAWPQVPVAGRTPEQVADAVLVALEAA